MAAPRGVVCRKVVTLGAREDPAALAPTDDHRRESTGSLARTSEGPQMSSPCVRNARRSSFDSGSLSNSAPRRGRNVRSLVRIVDAEERNLQLVRGRASNEGSTWSIGEGAPRACSKCQGRLARLVRSCHLLCRRKQTVQSQAPTHQPLPLPLPGHSLRRHACTRACLCTRIPPRSPFAGRQAHISLAGSSSSEYCVRQGAIDGVTASAIWGITSTPACGQRTGFLCPACVNISRSAIAPLAM